MQALWLENQQLSLRKDIPRPNPELGHALVRVRLAGICATDLEMVRGYYPFSGILGHEFVGEVVTAPDAVFWEGQRVVGEINIACGECAACRRGNLTHCEVRKVLGIRDYNGAFAEYLVLPLENLHVVPEIVPDEVAVFCEPLAAAMEILTQIKINSGDRVLLVGAGRLGQLIARVLALTGCELSVVTRHANQRKLLELCNIETLAEHQLKRSRWDIVVEATGSPEGFELARHVVRPRGVVVLKSTFKGDVQVNLASVVVDEITLIGSRCGPFSSALELLENGDVDPRPLVSARFPMDKGIEAIQRAGLPGTLKILIDPLDSAKKLLD